ncbi:MAG TPA: heavy-metal-associated domain-containing protein [Chitinophagaceae bacterium]|jgi:copper chaperone CopZ|nr:heavy-metal-associated domain-containing protein [Chitinophagaceae bacterium]
MKKVFLGLLAISGTALVSSAQVKASITAKIKTPTVGCDDCKNRIETYLKRYDGVTSVQVNWHQKITTVKYLTDRTNIEEIKAAISNCGYDADDIPAFEEAYKRLPKTCKKPEDGGPTKAPNIHAPPVAKQ